MTALAPRPTPQHRRRPAPRRRWHALAPLLVALLAAAGAAAVYLVFVRTSLGQTRRHRGDARRRRATTRGSSRCSAAPWTAPRWSASCWSAWSRRRSACSAGASTWPSAPACWCSAPTSPPSCSRPGWPGPTWTASRRPTRSPAGTPRPPPRWRSRWSWCCRTRCAARVALAGAGVRHGHRGGHRLGRLAPPQRHRRRPAGRAGLGRAVVGGASAPAPLRRHRRRRRPPATGWPCCCFAVVGALTGAIGLLGLAAVVAVRARHCRTWSPAGFAFLAGVRGHHRRRRRRLRHLGPPRRRRPRRPPRRRPPVAAPRAGTVTTPSDHRTGSPAAVHRPLPGAPAGPRRTGDAAVDTGTPPGPAGVPPGPAGVPACPPPTGATRPPTVVGRHLPRLRAGPAGRRLPVRQQVPGRADQHRRHRPAPGGERPGPPDHRPGGAGRRGQRRLVRPVHRPVLRHLQRLRAGSASSSSAC